MYGAGKVRPMTDRAACVAKDAADPLGPLREQFLLPEGVIYLDGNSLGALPRRVPAAIAATVRRDWGEGLIRSWTTADWIGKPHALGRRIARLIGAGETEVVVCDSTSVNLFKLLVAALRLKVRLGPERRVILSESGNFPTDLYIAEGVRSLFPACEIRLVETGGIAAALDRETAVVMLTHVNFRTGRVHDMAAINQAARAAGALTLWDLSHSVGALPLDLGRCASDLAIGCTYKYLNGGPGAPAFLFVRSGLQDAIEPPLSGWMGHAAPFDFAPDYRAAAGIARNLSGTPPVLGMVALEAALGLFEDLDMAAVRAKSIALGDLLITLVERTCAGHGFTLAAPREGARRGSQVSFRHDEGYAIMQALIGRGVIGDFRGPDLLRFGFAPLYLRYADVWDAVEHLAAVMDGREWDRDEHKVRAAVT